MEYVSVQEKKSSKKPLIISLILLGAALIAIIIFVLLSNRTASYIDVEAAAATRLFALMTDTQQGAQAIEDQVCEMAVELVPRSGLFDALGLQDPGTIAPTRFEMGTQIVDKRISVQGAYKGGGKSILSFNYWSDDEDEIFAFPEMTSYYLLNDEIPFSANFSSYADQFDMDDFKKSMEGVLLSYVKMVKGIDAEDSKEDIILKNGVKITTNKYIVTLSERQFGELAEIFFTSLLENEDFISYVNKSANQDITPELKEALANLKKQEYTDDPAIIMEVYGDKSNIYHRTIKLLDKSGADLSFTFENLNSDDYFQYLEVAEEGKTEMVFENAGVKAGDNYKGVATIILGNGEYSIPKENLRLDYNITSNNKDTADGSFTFSMSGSADFKLECDFRSDREVADMDFELYYTGKPLLGIFIDAKSRYDVAEADIPVLPTITDSNSVKISELSSYTNLSDNMVAMGNDIDEFVNTFLFDIVEDDSHNDLIAWLVREMLGGINPLDPSGSNYTDDFNYGDYDDFDDNDDSSGYFNTDDYNQMFDELAAYYGSYEEFEDYMKESFEEEFGTLDWSQYLREDGKVDWNALYEIYG